MDATAAALAIVGFAGAVQIGFGIRGLFLWVAQSAASSADKEQPRAPPITMEGPPRQVWRCMPGAGAISNLTLCDEGLPEDALPLGAEPPAPPPARTLNVRVTHVGMNFADVFAVTGLYSATPAGPFIPGLELSGVVEGGEVELPVRRRTRSSTGMEEKLYGDFPPGTRVMAVTRFGAYATRVNVDARCARPLPDGWSPAQGAAFCCQGLTAYYGLSELGGLRDGAGQTVLVHSAAGGVGIYAVRIVQAMGGNVIGTVGSEEKVEWLMEQTGLDRPQIIVRTDASAFGQQLDDALQYIGAAGIDISMDSLLGGYFAPTYDRLNAMGRVVVFGAGSMTTRGDSPDWLKLAWAWLRRPTLDPLAMIPYNRSVMAFNLIWLWEHLDECSDLLDDLLALELAPPVVGHLFAFDEAPEALRYFQTGNSVGKLVLEV